MIPSLEALRSHWLRSSWVLHMWRQAQTTGDMALEPLVGNGWLKDQHGNLAIDWDSEDNMTQVRSRVDLVLKGCSCKGGCSTNKCGCRKKGIPCGVGCRCTGCENQEHHMKQETWKVTPTLKKVTQNVRMRALTHTSTK